VKILIVSMAAILLACVSGCATQQETLSANQDAGPIITGSQNVAALTQQTQTAATDTLSQAETLQKQVPTNLQTQAGAVVTSAQTTQSAATAAALAAKNQVAAAQKLPAAIVSSEQASAAAEKTRVENTLSYKIGHAIVIAVFLLVVVGGLIWFSESGFAASIALKFPILATIIFKPLEYFGTWIGEAWGLIEYSLAWLWSRVKGWFSSASASNPSS
jgi:hypothetical protein